MLCVMICPTCRPNKFYLHYWQLHWNFYIFITFFTLARAGWVGAGGQKTVICQAIQPLFEQTQSNLKPFYFFKSWNLFEPGFFFLSLDVFKFLALFCVWFHFIFLISDCALFLSFVFHFLYFISSSSVCFLFLPVFVYLYF